MQEVDEQGNVWEVEGNVRLLIEPSIEWITRNQKLPSLSEVKEKKILELNTACNQDILNGFPSSCTGAEYQYNFDLEYQANMNQRATMFLLKLAMSETWWPTKDYGVVIHTREQFFNLCEDAERIKDEKIFRYFGMKAQILSPTITTVEQVEAFVW